MDGASLCRGLKERNFLRCWTDLRSYNASAMYAATADRCVMENNAGHYPHRSASHLSGVSRCLGAVQAAEAASAQQAYALCTHSYDERAHAYALTIRSADQPRP